MIIIISFLTTKFFLSVDRVTRFEMFMAILALILTDKNFITIILYITSDYL